jgi:RimJ/RimL family protein N-acetyltransferase
MRTCRRSSASSPRRGSCSSFSGDPQPHDLVGLGSLLNDPPYRIETERLVVRCWEPADAPGRADAIESSLDHLRPWMLWSHDEPKSPEDRVRLLRSFRGEFDLGRNFVYGILSADESEVVGGTGLHLTAGEGALEIGYWIRASRAGEGLATESTAALTRVAFEVCGVDRVDIRVEPENAASAAIPRKLGYGEEATLRRRLDPLPGGEPRDAVIFSLFRDAFPSTPSASATLTAYDAIGGRIL